MQLTLILLHPQHVIGLAICDLLDNLPLASRGVNDNDAAVEIRQVQQLRNDGDPIWPGVTGIKPFGSRALPWLG